MVVWQQLAWVALKGWRGLAPSVAHFAPFFFLWKSLTFDWTALSSFQSTKSIFLFCVPNFCLDCPFRFSAHRDAHFLPKPPFRVFNLASCSFFIYRKNQDWYADMHTSQRDVICYWYANFSKRCHLLLNANLSKRCHLLLNKLPKTGLSFFFHWGKGKKTYKPLKDKHLLEIKLIIFVGKIWRQTNIGDSAGEKNYVVECRVCKINAISWTTFQTVTAGDQNSIQEQSGEKRSIKTLVREYLN